MGFNAAILADSVSTSGYRLVTMEATFPRLVLAEFNTHRVFSRNSASSRAIPVAKQLERVIKDPFVPAEFGANRPGMQAGERLSGDRHELAQEQWLLARDEAVLRALALIGGPEVLELAESSGPLAATELVGTLAKNHEIPETWPNVHKQITNRLLEPFMWHTVIVTATEWDNFWNLRTHPDAQPEIRRLARLMKAQWLASTPSTIDADGWHMPLVDDDEKEALGHDGDFLRKVCVGRCARVSYLTHSGLRDHLADVQLHDRLIDGGHMSPFEHVARPIPSDVLRTSATDWSGNFRGWIAYRKDIPQEANPLARSPMGPALVTMPI